MAQVGRSERIRGVSNVSAVQGWLEGSAHHRPGRYYHHNPWTAHRKLAAEKLSRPYQTVGPEAPVSHRSAAQDGQVA